MSTKIESERILSPSPQSPKKRKVATTDPDTSNKRRKRDKIDNNTEAEKSATSKKDKKRKKQKESGEENLGYMQKSSVIEDVELPDAPAEKTSPPVDVITNGGFEAADTLPELIEEVDNSQLQSQQPSCFYEKRLSLQLPIPAISLASSTSSLLSVHLAPLLLTYFPPADGIVLSFSDPVLSATSAQGVNLPLVPPRSNEIPRHPPDETFARCGDGYGVCWVWLTATFLVFKPESGDELKGWTNVTSEGFVGLVSYNYFQTAVGKSRISKAWVWNGPTEMNATSKKKSRRVKLQSENGASTSQEEWDGAGQHTDRFNDEVGDELGSFLLSDGEQVPATQTFRVVDTEMVPGHEKDRWTLQIEGSLLSPEDDALIVAEERKRFEQLRDHGRNRSATIDSQMEGLPFMSGALPFSQAASPE